MTNVAIWSDMHEALSNWNSRCVLKWPYATFFTFYNDGLLTHSQSVMMIKSGGISLLADIFKFTFFGNPNKNSRLQIIPCVWMSETSLVSQGASLKLNQLAVSRLLSLHTLRINIFQSNPIRKVSPSCLSLMHSRRESRINSALCSIIRWTQNGNTTAVVLKHL